METVTHEIVMKFIYDVSQLFLQVELKYPDLEPPISILGTFLPIVVEAIKQSGYVIFVHHLCSQSYS